MNSISIIYISKEFYDSKRRARKHHLAQALSQHTQIREILYVNPHRHRWQSPSNSPSSISSIRTWQGTLMIPGERFDWVRRINRWFIHRKLEKQIEHRNYWHSIFYNPFDVHLVKRIKKCQEIIFDWTDDWPIFYDNSGLQSSQELAIKIASKIIAVNESLRDRAIQLKGTDQNVLLLPNATSFRPQNNFHIPEEISSIPKPRVGYIGHIGPWFNSELVRKIARTRQNLHWIMIGNVDSNKRKELGNLKNIHILGQKNHSNLQSYMGHCQVLCAPYINEFEGDSTKLYDYLTVGSPIISSDIETAYRLRPHVKIATNLQSWLTTIDHVLKEDDISLQQARKDESLKHTWKERAKALLNWLNTFRN